MAPPPISGFNPNGSITLPSRSARKFLQAASIIANMSANLDKSLDDLVGNRRQNARRRAGPRRAATKKPSVGGVKKSTKATPKAAHPAPVTAIASSKILVSGLPADVTEANVKPRGANDFDTLCGLFVPTILDTRQTSPYFPAHIFGTVRDKLLGSVEVR
ncbi:unnamed protein product [Penicillium bialowiezense]